MMPSRKNNQNWLPSFFNDFFDNDWMIRTNATAPAINVIESDKEYKVEVAAPGMTKDDFNIHLTEDNELVITMEKKNETKEEDKQNKKYLRREFSYSKFEQAFVLPDDVEKEKINAGVNDGVLTIELPKRTAEERAKVNRVIGNGYTPSAAGPDSGAYLFQFNVKRILRDYSHAAGGMKHHIVYLYIPAGVQHNSRCKTRFRLHDQMVSGSRDAVTVRKTHGSR